MFSPLWWLGCVDPKFDGKLPMILCNACTYNYVHDDDDDAIEGGVILFKLEVIL